MEDTSERLGKKPLRHINIGLLAHVDAGKTTLSEAILYASGSIRQMGRVDHKNAFLDTFALERERGITIFSKQAVLAWEGMELTLLDTPGHVDFSAEMERTIQVMDYGILVISGADGVQGHTQTLWKLLAHYQVPVFLFVNKMDQPGTDPQLLLDQLKKKLDENCIDFTDFAQCSRLEEFQEALAMSDEKLLEEYLEAGTVDLQAIPQLIRQRKIFPCYFGSALKFKGIEELLRGIESFTCEPDYPADFGAKVFKIARDDQGNRLTYLKITGGALKVKSLLTNQREGDSRDQGIWQEKVNQIRIYSGEKYTVAEEAPAGTICAVTGLSLTRPGQGLGKEPEADMPVLEPVLNYQIQLPPGCDVHKMFLQLKELEEEDPQLHIVWREELNEIHVQLMGEVQLEILRSMIWERFHVEVAFGTGNIVYKETIANKVEGIGHFEPLRHYAEVHLLLEPAERGSGLQFHTACSEDVLERNWQRLILTHLEEREHPGVLTGSGITDMSITLLTGKAHVKHTEGGDFRQAAYRAVRQGLKQAKNILLEPWYHFRLELPAEYIGHAMSDIQRMQGSFEEPQANGEEAVLEGSCPVATMRDYQREVLTYTRGLGRLLCSLEGYAPCHNQEEVVEALGYDSERDPANPTGSVFCAHGAGFVVRWDKVREYMHVDSGIRLESLGNTLEAEEYDESGELQASQRTTAGYQQEEMISQEEVEAIFERTYGPLHRDRNRGQARKITAPPSTGIDKEAWKKKNKKQEKLEEYLLVDGYNIIFAWEELQALAKDSLESARARLMDILCNYQGYQACTLILVFDAYKVKGGHGAVQKYHNIYVVYTKEAETADQYIEKTVHQIGKKYRVTVATSDRLEQMIILGAGATRLSARGFQEEIKRVEGLIQEKVSAGQQE